MSILTRACSFQKPLLRVVGCKLGLGFLNPVFVIAAIGAAVSFTAPTASATSASAGTPAGAIEAKTETSRVRSLATKLTRAPACTNSRSLGVSRVITIDTRKQTHFGSQQYKFGPDLLRDREVVLTFDDGPLRRKTRKVLKALKRHCTKATFFAVGRMAIADPATLRMVAADGHTIGHHTWSHKNQKQQSLSRAIAEFELGVSAVEAVIGRPSSPFFRFPYLADAARMQRYMVQRGFGIFSIDIDSYDWRSKSANAVYRQVMRKLRSRGKGIVLFHDIQRATANSIDRLLDEMYRSGFKVVHFEAARTATALPEYNADARRLLEKRNFRRSARSLKTAFRFQDPGPRARPATARSVTAKSKSQRPAGSTVDNRDRRDQARPTSARAAPGSSKQPQAAATRQPAVPAAPTRTAPRPALRKPRWQDEVFWR
ncbi:MAG: polysaccharide deacetylase family protein [Pseudomonadota bacterium]